MPLVFLQAVDECQTVDQQKRDETMARLLNFPNMHMTGDIHGVLAAHVGMRVRLAAKVSQELGLVQETTATIVDFLFHDADRARYEEAAQRAAALASEAATPYLTILTRKVVAALDRRQGRARESRNEERCERFRNQRRSGW